MDHLLELYELIFKVWGNDSNLQTDSSMPFNDSEKNFLHLINLISCKIQSNPAKMSLLLAVDHSYNFHGLAQLLDHPSIYVSYSTKDLLSLVCNSLEKDELFIECLYKIILHICAQARHCHALSHSIDLFHSLVQDNNFLKRTLTDKWKLLLDLAFSNDSQLTNSCERSKVVISYSVIRLYTKLIKYSILNNMNTQHLHEIFNIVLFFIKKLKLNLIPTCCLRKALRLVENLLFKDEFVQKVHSHSRADERSYEIFMFVNKILSLLVTNAKSNSNSGEEGSLNIQIEKHDWTKSLLLRPSNYHSFIGLGNMKGDVDSCNCVERVDGTLMRKLILINLQCIYIIICGPMDVLENANTKEIANTCSSSNSNINNNNGDDGDFTILALPKVLDASLHFISYLIKTFHSLPSARKECHRCNSNDDNNNDDDDDDDMNKIELTGNSMHKEITNIFQDQDDSMVRMLMCTLHIRQQLVRLAKIESSHMESFLSNDIVLSLNPYILLIHTLQFINWKHSVIIDWLLSPETCFLEYFIKLLKFIGKNDTEKWVESCSLFDQMYECGDDGKDDDDGGGDDEEEEGGDCKQVSRKRKHSYLSADDDEEENEDGDDNDNGDNDAKDLTKPFNLTAYSDEDEEDEDEEDGGGNNNKLCENDNILDHCIKDLADNDNELSNNNDMKIETSDHNIDDDHHHIYTSDDVKRQVETDEDGDGANKTLEKFKTLFKKLLHSINNFYGHGHFTYNPKPLLKLLHDIISMI